MIVEPPAVKTSTVFDALVDSLVKAAAELGCHFAGVMFGENSRFRQIPSLHVTNLEELRTIVENLQENRNALVPNN
jgi:hypothetical protein